MLSNSKKSVSWIFTANISFPKIAENNVHVGLTKHVHLYLQNIHRKLTSSCKRRSLR